MSNSTQSCSACTYTVCSCSSAQWTYDCVLCLYAVLLGVLVAGAQTEMKRVVGDNATLPCHHQFWVGDDPTLDIEWLLLKPNNKHRVVSLQPGTLENLQYITIVPARHY